MEIRTGSGFFAFLIYRLRWGSALAFISSATIFLFSNTGISGKLHQDPPRYVPSSGLHE